jgi:two-component system chemotaxis sensor kinase CheA
VNLSPDPNSSELLDVFFESAEELLQNMNGGGLALEKNPDDPEQLRHVRRAVHTLKGDSAACGFRELSELAHALEDLLTPELVKEKAKSVAEAILSAADVFAEMLEAYRKNSAPPQGSGLRKHIESLLTKPAPQPIPVPPSGPQFGWTEYERLLIGEACRRGETVYHIVLELAADTFLPGPMFELARKALENAGKLLAINPSEASDSAGIRFIEAALSTTESIEGIKQRCRIPSVVEKLTIEPVDAPQAKQSERDALQVLLEAEAAAVSAEFKESPERLAHESTRAASSPMTVAVSQSVESTLRVDPARIDSVMNLVGELIIGKSMLQRAIAEFEHKYTKDPLRTKMSDALAFQSRILTELQKSVMEIRMVPVEQLFRRFPRLVRDLARLLQKEIQLEIRGEKTDLDKSILDALAEPLAHLVRNAADHGIEPAQERQLSGKPTRATIQLNAYHDGDQVVIEISDDGRGLDRDKIGRSAVNKGLLTTDEAARLTEQEALQFVFTPGFSTAGEITETSGRGVGLDVVKAVLENLKGTIEVISEKGRGTTFRLLVPLTLASIQALLFRVQERLYAVPLASVVEITRMNEDDIHRVDECEVFQLRKQLLPLIRLEQIGARVMRERSSRMFVVIVATGGRRFGLVVDSLMGEEELVVKPLEDQLLASPLVSGASILGDGTVVMILNVAAVVLQFAKPAPVGATV